MLLRLNSKSAHYNHKKNVAIKFSNKLEAEKREKYLCVIGLSDNTTDDITSLVYICCNQLELPSMHGILKSHNTHLLQNVTIKFYCIKETFFS